MAYEKQSSPLKLGRREKTRALPVKNFSRQGICFLAKEKLEPGKLIKIYLKIGQKLPVQTLKAQIRNIRSGDDSYPYIMGASFTEMTPKTWHMLSRIRKKGNGSGQQMPEKPLDDTEAGAASRMMKNATKWEGQGDRWIENFTTDRPWRLMWAVEGGYWSSFGITIYGKDRNDLLLRPVNEHNINGTKEGSVDINCTGRLLLKVTAGGPDKTHWLILVPDS